MITVLFFDKEKTNTRSVDEGIILWSKTGHSIILSTTNLSINQENSPDFNTSGKKHRTVTSMINEVTE